MQFTPDELSHFHLHGWTVKEGVFTAEETEPIAELAVQLGGQELSADVTSDLADYSSNGEQIPRKLNSPFLRHASFRRFVLDDRLQQLVGQLIDKPPLLISDQVFLKPPHHGSAKPYHQDNAYFLCEPADDVITAWIALDDADETNGCLHYINGSHKEAVLEHVPDPSEPHNKAPSPDLIDTTREAAACVRRGGVVFHHSQALHMTPRNESDRWRRAYATHWGSADVTSRTETVNVAYYNASADLYREAEAAEH